MSAPAFATYSDGIWSTIERDVRDSLSEARGLGA
jgi:hypothetical protein